MPNPITLPAADMALIVDALTQGAENCGYDPACLWAAPIAAIYAAAIGYDPLLEGWSLQEACEILLERFPL